MPKGSFRLGCVPKAPNVDSWDESGAPGPGSHLQWLLELSPSLGECVYYEGFQFKPFASPGSLPLVVYWVWRGSRDGQNVPLQRGG